MRFQKPPARRSRHHSFNPLTVFLTLLLPAAGQSEPAALRAKPAPAETALIFYDSSGPYGWIGGLHAKMLANLLGHFQLDYTISPVESYTPGSIGLARATFYFGTVFDNPLPASFLQEVMSTDKPVCWFRYNLWQVGRDSEFGSAFETRTGFRFEFMDSSGYESVTYEGEAFDKNQIDAELGRTTILDPHLAAAPAMACRQTTSSCIPYIIQGGNFWYVADSPFAYLGEEDRYVVFADLLHDILKVSHPQSHRAIIRLEDVDPTSPSEQLRLAADYLHSEGVPFLISVVPVYADPLGFFNQGVSKTVPMSRAPEFVETLKYLVAQGGQIVLEGYTHQYDSIANPYSGVTGEDYEFFRVTVDAQNNFVEYGPVPDDSKHWVQSRVREALRQFKHTGLSVTAWQTPQYAASALDYTVFADFFPLTIQRVLYSDDAAGVAPGNGKKTGPLGTQTHFAGQFFPYVIQRDAYGQKVVPENIGNIILFPLGGSPQRLPSDLIRAAKKNLAVRDGWASAFIHPFLDLSYLRELVQGVKASGYVYVPLAADVQ